MEAETVPSVTMCGVPTARAIRKSCLEQAAGIMGCVVLMLTV